MSLFDIKSFLTEEFYFRGFLHSKNLRIIKTTRTEISFHSNRYFLKIIATKSYISFLWPKAIKVIS